MSENLTGEAFLFPWYHVFLDSAVSLTMISEAVKEFQMVEDGDRVLVCLSGGKDSLSLLHTMRYVVL